MVATATSAVESAVSAKPTGVVALICLYTLDNPIV